MAMPHHPMTRCWWWFAMNGEGLVPFAFCSSHRAVNVHLAKGMALSGAALATGAGTNVLLRIGMLLLGSPPTRCLCSCRGGCVHLRPDRRGARPAICLRLLFDASDHLPARSVFVRRLHEPGSLRNRPVTTDGPQGRSSGPWLLANGRRFSANHWRLSAHIRPPQLFITYHQPSPTAVRGFAPPLFLSLW